MDKMFSVRLDEPTIGQISRLARRLGKSKKEIIERAVRAYATGVDQEQHFNPLQQSWGAWQRKAGADQIVQETRKAFQDSIKRHRQ